MFDKKKKKNNVMLHKIKKWSYEIEEKKYKNTTPPLSL